VTLQRLVLDFRGRELVVRCLRPLAIRLPGEVEHGAERSDTLLKLVERLL
jgi:hypothetical protein